MNTNLLHIKKLAENIKQLRNSSNNIYSLIEKIDNSRSSQQITNKRLRDRVNTSYSAINQALNNINSSLTIIKLESNLSEIIEPIEKYSNTISQKYEELQEANENEAYTKFSIRYKILHSQVQALETMITTISSYFQKTVYLQLSKNYDLTSNKELIILYFEGNTLITSITDISKSLNVWKRVFNWLGRGIKENDNDLEIVSIRRGSLIITLGSNLALALFFIKVLSQCLDLIKKFWELKKYSLEIKKMALEVQKLKNEVAQESLNNTQKKLEEEANTHLIESAKRISKKLIEESEHKYENENENEVRIGLEKAILHISKFLDLGGKSEVKLLEMPKEENILKEIDEKFMAIEKQREEILELDKNVSYNSLLEEILKENK